jgi:hypothetical protein
MPVSAHFKGKGEKVMASMMKQYGPKKAKQVFYATEQKQKGHFAGVKPKREK